MILVLGVCDIYDIICPEKVPVISYKFGTEATSKAKLNTSNLDDNHMDPEICWKNLQEPIAILEKICPEAADWIKEAHAKNMISWPNVGNETFYAKYNILNGQVLISKYIFYENDGTKASIIAHEFRHSRQNYTRLFRATIAFLIRKDSLDAMRENDACLFEQEVYLAIFR